MSPSTSLATLLQIARDHRASWKAVRLRSAAAAEYLTDKEKGIVSKTMICGVVLTFISFALLLLSFSTPNWMESRPHAYSEFVKLGLWQVCFNKYLHHSFQFHHPFTGCHWIYSQEYRPIWEFILPPWFLAVQGFVTIALILTLSSLLLLTLVAAQVVRTGTSLFIRASSVQNGFSGVSLLIAIITFGIQAEDQKWMPHQLYNFYSWSFWLGFVAILFLLTSSAVMLKEAGKTRDLELARPSIEEPFSSMKTPKSALNSQGTEL